MYQFTERTVLIIEKGMTGATGNVYCGLHEFEDMSFVLHLLKPGDLFVDVGANVGSYTILASGHVGAFTISVEPIPSTFGRLRRNIAVNGIEHLVLPVQTGVGAGKENLYFTTTHDTVNHVLGKSENSDETISVPIDTLDSILDQKDPFLIKIDVEGFETAVIQGGMRTLKNPSLKSLIIELNGSGERYGFKDETIHKELLGIGFLPCCYDPFKRTLTPLESFGTTNTIYVRDMALVQERLKMADRFKIFGVSL